MRVLITIAFLFYFTLIVKSQDKLDSSTYFAKGVELGFRINEIHRLYEGKVDLWNLDGYLKDLNIDVKKSSRVVNGVSREIALLISENIIDGETIAINYNIDTNASYHSEYLIKVFKSYSGKHKIGDTVSIRQSFGPRKNLNNFIFTSMDIYLNVGTRYIFFLKDRSSFYKDALIYAPTGWSKEFSDSKSIMNTYKINEHFPKDSKFFKENELIKKLEIVNKLKIN